MVGMRGKKNEYKNFNITKLDSKGRITIPFHVREYMGLKDGSEFLVVNNENKELGSFHFWKEGLHILE